MNESTREQKPTTARDYISTSFFLLVMLGLPLGFMMMAFVVGCGQRYPSVAHTLTFKNTPQTAFQCMQTTGKGAGRRCLEAHPEARKTFGPNGFDKDMGDCLYDYPEIGFQKKDFYLDQPAN